MKIAVLGAGFTGLSAALRLAQAGHQVTLFECSNQVGGMAVGFKDPAWEWPLEKSYHHWFTNDRAALSLAKQLGHSVQAIRPETNIFINQQILPIDSPTALLAFPYLSPLSKMRTASSLAYLKLIRHHRHLEGKKALQWTRRFMGKESARLIWEPLFESKFGMFKEDIALTWFWGRIKKRTPTLCYPEGGFQTFADRIAREVEKAGGKILLKTPVIKIESRKTPCLIQTADKSYNFDRVAVTLPTSAFVKIAPQLPKKYVRKISSIPHLSAQNLILILNKPFLKSTYWLNINDPEFPFLLLAEHTNFIGTKYYGNQHILYIGNYLPSDHPYLKKSAGELLKIYDPFLKKINPDYRLSTIDYRLFTQPFAQPVVTTDYPKLMLGFKTPLENVYLANLDMVYPWDRGTNYAIELGEKVARLCETS